VPEQARLDVLGCQRLTQQRIAAQVDLADGQIVVGPPPGVQLGDLRVVRSGEGAHQLVVVGAGLVFRYGGHGGSFR